MSENFNSCVPAWKKKSFIFQDFKPKGVGWGRGNFRVVFKGQNMRDFYFASIPFIKEENYAPAQQ